MKLKIYSIKDLAAQAYGRPMFFQTTGLAHRSFADEVNRADDNNMLHKHPADFELYHIGDYNEDDASFETHAPVLVVRALDVSTRSVG